MISRVGALILVAAALTACSGPRVTILTGTTIGLKATPGDGSSRPPGVTLGYKRAEVALVPTEGKTATETTDISSTVASLRFSTEWFRHTELDSFIATGFAAAPLMKPGSEFGQAFAEATLGVVSSELADRQQKLIAQLRGLNEPQAKQILDDLKMPVKRGKTAKDSLQDYVARADTDAALASIEAAFFRRK